MVKNKLICLLLVIFFIAGCYAAGRVYYHITAGFSLENISSDFADNSAGNVRALTEAENTVLQKAIDQPYTYLGKGCQSYVFLSRDGEYVVKFFKCQKFRLLPWLAYLPPLPAIVQFRAEKAEAKRKKLEDFVFSWKTVFENLKEETGLIFVHLNKTTNMQKNLTIVDKTGKRHILELDRMEFCIQKRAELLCPYILKLKENNNIQEARILVNNLLNLILSEYRRGFADNDHALMQNTGVAGGMPIHIDIGQFTASEDIKNPAVYRQELYTKTFKFMIWLRENYPDLAVYLEERLSEIIGPEYVTLKPKFRIK